MRAHDEADRQSGGVKSVMRPFYFGVVFWGHEFRTYFLDYCLPSLLAPGNIPALENMTGSRFLICTTADDWAAMQNNPTLLALRRMIEPVFLEISRPASNANVTQAVSEGEKLAAVRASAERACGVFLKPDFVLADGSVEALQQLASKGSTAVLCAAMQMTTQECLSRHDVLRGSTQGGPLVLRPCTLAGIVLHNTRSMMLYHDWDTPIVAERLSGCFWRVPGGDGIILHSFNWVPLLINYAALADHRPATYGHRVVDGEYLLRNFSLHDRIHVVRDSDEICVVSFSRKREFPRPLFPTSSQVTWHSRWPGFRHYWKMHCLRSIKNNGALSPLERHLFALSVRWHGGIDSPAWKKTEARAAKIVAKVFRDPSPLENACAGVVRFVRKEDFSPLGRVEMLADLARAEDSQYVNQAGVGSHCIWLIGPPVSSGCWYWEVFSPNWGAGGGSIADMVTIGIVTPRHPVADEVGAGRYGWGWRGDGQALHAGRMAFCGKGVSGENQVVMVALDMDAGKIWFGLNGQWFEDGDPAAGTHPAFDGLKKTVYPAISSRHGGHGTAVLFTRVTPKSWTYEPPKGFQSLMEADGRPTGDDRVAP